MLALGSLESGKLWVEFVEDLGVDPELPSEYAHKTLEREPAGDTGTEVSGDMAGLRLPGAEAEADAGAGTEPGARAGAGAERGGEDGREAAMGLRVGESGEAATEVGEVTTEGEVGEVMPPGRTGRRGIDMGGSGGSGAFQGLVLEAAVGVVGVEAALAVVIIVAAFCLSAPGCCDPVLSQLGASTADLGVGSGFDFTCCGGGGGGAEGGPVVGPEIPVRVWIGATGSFLSNGLTADVADVADVGAAAIGVVVVVGGADLGGA